VSYDVLDLFVIMQSGSRDWRWHRQSYAAFSKESLWRTRPSFVRDRMRQWVERGAVNSWR
jgi:hypothetical protein